MNPYGINQFIRARKMEDKTVENIKSDMDMMDEVSWSESDVFQSYAPYGANPDQIVKNKTLKIYQEMEQDDQIKASLEMRIQARLSTKWDVKPGVENNAKSKEMAEFIKFNLNRMSGPFESDLEQIYSAYAYGFSISEKIYEYIESGKFSGKIGLKDIKTKEPFHYDFKVDAHGNLLGLVYTGPIGKEERVSFLSPSLGAAGSKVNQMGTFENPFPIEKFIIYSYNSRFGNWYGRSDYRGAFPWWVMKKHGRKFWAVWLERYASPLVWAQYKKDAGIKPATHARVDDLIRNLSTRQGIRVSDAWTLNALEFSGQGADTYEKSVESFNRFISRSILMPNLMGFTQQPQTGSYSLGQKHFDAFVWVLNKMGRDTSEIIVGDQIIKPLIQLNYGDVEDEFIPKFEFTSVEDGSIDIRSQIITRLAQFGLLDPNEEWIRDFLTLPVIKSGTELPIPGKDTDETPPVKKDEKEPIRKDESLIIPAINKTFKERELTSFEEKVRIKSLEATINSLDDEVEKEMAVEIEGIRDSLIDQIIKKRIVSDQDSSAVKTLVVNASELKKILEKWITKIWLDSSLRALEEIGRAGLDIEIDRKFQKFALSAIESWEPLPPQEALDYFRRKVSAKIIDKNGKKKIIDISDGTDLTFIRNRAFTVAGVIRDDILNDARQLILNGIKRQSEIETIMDLKGMFNRYLDQGIAVDDELLKPSRLRTIVRTNTMEAINEGRKAMMTHPDVTEYVQYFQYSAILDERTTDYCNCMDSKIFRIEQLDQLKPPAHYNCRSYIVSVTEMEIDSLKSKGKGIEISSPCPDRMAGFEYKGPPIYIPTQDIVDVLDGVKKNIPEPIIDKPIDIIDKPIDIKEDSSSDKDERLKRQLNTVIARCPYQFCRSNKIDFVKAIMHTVGEYKCNECTLPFRVSIAVDLYFYDPAVDKWERVTQGNQPAFFSRKVK